MLFSVQEILKVKDQYDVIGLDCFDTLVHRRCDPEEVLFKWSKNISEYVDFKYEPEQIYSLRKKSEYQKKRKTEEISYEELMKTVYSSMKLKITFKQFYEYAKKVELQIEQEYLEKDEEVMELLKELSDYRLVIVSDFYFGKEMLSELLQEMKMPVKFENIYVSSDIGARKSSGNLFRYVLEDLQIDSAQMLFIGDNIVSDIEKPESLGISVCYKKNNITRKAPVAKGKLWQMVKGQMIVTKQSELLNGYIAPMIVFCDNLYREIVRNQICDIFFLSREGQRLKQLFDLYLESLQTEKKITTHYLYISRKAAAIASLEDAEKESFQGILSDKNEYTVRSYLDFIGIDKTTIKMILNQTQLSGDDIVLSYGVKQRAYTLLQNCPAYSEEYNRIRTEQKKMILEYFSKFSVDFPKKGLTIVDVGWKGSIQDKLRKLFPENVIIQGYYMGIYDNNPFVEECLTAENNRKSGLVFSTSPRPNKEYYAYRKNRILWEFVLAADHGPVDGYYRNSENDKVEPRIGYNVQDQKNYAYIAPLWSRTMVNFKTILQCFQEGMYTVHSFAENFAEEYMFFTIMILPRYMNFFEKMVDHYQDNYITGTKKTVGIKNIKKRISFLLYTLFADNKKILDIIYKYKPLFVVVAWLFYKKELYGYRVRSCIDYAKKIYTI